MTWTPFGIDFGTTNSLAALIEGNRALSLVEVTTQRPHPSVAWYRGSDVVVGRRAREQMDLTEGGAPPGFVRSPKSALRRDGPLYIDGRALNTIDVVAEVLRHLQADAALPRESMSGYTLSRAVMTIPVDFGGSERRALRQAARKAGINIVQFVHEPAAALYAYLRSELEIETLAALSRLEGRAVLVFDWGGGTLDLTLCRIDAGAIVQVSNLGLNDVGGDRFDERIRNLVRKKHAESHALQDITALEQPGMAAKLLQQCERVKIGLSRPSQDREDVIVRNFLRVDGPARDLVGFVTKQELEEHTADIVRRGLGVIDQLLEEAGHSADDIALCLAVGGMTNMPAIMNGLTERFLGRVPQLVNGDRIIAEGAAWIAHDGVRLVLSKPIELLVADTSGYGAYHPLVPAGQILPIENETLNAANLRLFCSDPREGRAMVEVVKPLKPTRTSPSDPRRSIAVGCVEVDQSAKPMIERINCQMQIDHDYVGRLILTSTAKADRTTLEFYDLEFALSLRVPEGSKPGQPEPSGMSPIAGMRRVQPLPRSNVTSRSNIAVVDDDRTNRRVIPGDLARKWWPNYFDVQSREPTPRQREEDEFYRECAVCYRLPTELREDGCERCKILPQGA